MELKCKNCGTYVAEIPADTEWLLVERCSECPQQEPNRALSNYIQDHGSEVNACVGEPAAEVLLRLLEHYAKPCPHCEDTANQLADRNRRLAEQRQAQENQQHWMDQLIITSDSERDDALDRAGEALAVAERAVGIAERLEQYVGSLERGENIRLEQVLGKRKAMIRYNANLYDAKPMRDVLSRCGNCAHWGGPEVCRGGGRGFIEYGCCTDWTPL